MFKQDEHRLILQKRNGGIDVEIGEMDINEQLFTIKNVLSIIAWVNNLKPDENMKKTFGK